MSIDSLECPLSERAFRIASKWPNPVFSLEDVVPDCEVGGEDCPVKVL